MWWRRFFILGLIGWLLMPFAGAERKKVGLVLGGGGAKGVAHVGVLKVLEEAGIPIDYIAGTSMGAIVGGLYAIGYSASEIDSMVRVQDWSLLLSDRVRRNDLSFPEKENSERYVFSLPFGKKEIDIEGMIKGLNLQNLFSSLTIGYHDSVDFNRLNIPFACVALNVVDGKEYVFHEGSLPLAMRASMAIPAVFAPVRLDSMVLVDGGIKNNYPADVAKDMGADIIIGVDLGTSDLKQLERIKTPWDIVGQIIALHGYEKYGPNREMTDLLFRPDTDPFTSASFSEQALDTLIDRGEQIARAQWDEILALKKRIGLASDEKPYPTVGSSHVYPTLNTDTFRIRSIRYEGVDPRDEKWLSQISGLKENSLITMKDLEKAMSVVVGTNLYANVNYKLVGERQEDLVLTVQEKSNTALNVGLNFNTEDIVNLLLNLTYSNRVKYHSRFSVTGRIGKRTYGRVDYAVERNPLRNFNFSYMFTYHDLDVYNRGDKVVNVTYRHHFAELGYSDMNWLNFKLKLGLRYEYFDYNSVLYTIGNQDYEATSDGFISYFVQAHLETLDRRYFPSKGVSLEADYSIYTDNFVTYKGHTFFSALKLGFLTVLPLTSHLCLLPSVNGRVLIGQDPAYPFLNAVGGDMPEHYLPQQLAFAGLSHVEIFNNSVVIVGLTLRQRVSDRHYFSLVANYAIHEDNFFDLFEGESVWGGSIGYAYNSIVGPMSLNLGLSNRDKSPQFYLNLGYSF